MTEYDENQLVRELRSKLDALGKRDVRVNRTMLWHYGIDKRVLEGLKGVLNSEVERTKFARFVADLFAGDRNARDEIMGFVRRGTFTDESYFSRGGMPENWFYNNPPVENPGDSNRILITGTNAEVQSLDIYVKKRTGRSDDVPKILRDYDRDVKIPQDLLERIRSSKIKYCSQVGSFWQSFFGEKDFLDKPISIPRQIVATGFMRNYNMQGGETIDVRDRLEEVAKVYGSEIEFIPSFCI